MKKFTWDIGYLCNFNCPYCFHTAERSAPHEPQAPLPSPEEAVSAWRRVHDLFGAAKVCITGGEPFLFPAFADVLSGISAFHFVHVTTNMSLPPDEIIRDLDPARVEFNATFHPLRMSPDVFVSRVQGVRKAGFSCGVCYLAHPLQLREMLNYKRYFAAGGLPFGVTRFRGIYAGVEYPAGYSDGEREYLSLVEHWTPGCEEAGGGADGQRLPFSGDAGDRRGRTAETRACGAGADHAVVRADGTVVPCGRRQSPALGNLFSGGVRLLNEPAPCPLGFDGCDESDVV